MKTLIPIKSPQLLVGSLDDQHSFVVNCAYPNSLRILNRAQHEIVTGIDNQTSIENFGDKLGSKPDEIGAFLQMLAQTEIVRFGHSFRSPQKPPHPTVLNFWIHTTNRCNLSCSYCYIATLNTTSGMSERTRQQLLMKMVETVQKRHITSIKLRLAGGEPLSQFKAWKAFIPQARQTLQELGCQLDCSFITNLTILTEEMIAFSKEYQIDYGVSLDGVGADHDQSRRFKSGVGSFTLVDRHLRTLLAHQIPVSTNTVVTNSNLAGLLELTRYLIDLDIPFRYSIVKGETIDANLLDQHLSGAYALMRDAIGQGWRFSQRHQFCDLKPSDLGFQTCASGFSGGAIHVDGRFHYCHVHFGDETKVSYSLFDPDLDLVDMIEQGSHEEDNRSLDCQSCRYRSVCTSGCPVYRVNGKDPQCSLYHRFIPLIYELQARERLKLLQEYTMMT